jgi:SAM-dependent methyltransferase
MSTIDVPAELTFYHTIEIAPGVTTPGWPVVRPIVDMIRDEMAGLDFKGKRVLDIGCRDGALSFEAERLGAAEVIGIDSELPQENLAFLSKALRSSVRFERRNLFDIKPDTFGTFDIVLFAGVLYHLRYPFSALRLLKDLVREEGFLLTETATFTNDNMLPLVFCPVGEDSPYEPTSCTFFNVKGFTETARGFGLAVLRHRSLLNLPPYDGKTAGKNVPIDRTVFVCVHGGDGDAPSAMNYWDNGADPHSPFSHRDLGTS